MGKLHYQMVKSALEYIFKGKRDNSTKMYARGLLLLAGAVFFKHLILTKLLGMKAEDVKKYKLERQIIRLKDNDKKRLEQMKNYEWFKNHKEWQKQFKKMKDMKGKVELDALITRGITFVSDTYLPEKIKAKDWID